MAQSIVQCILDGRSKEVVLLGMYAWVSTVKGWPNWMQEGLRDRGALP